MIVVEKFVYANNEDPHVSVAPMVSEPLITSFLNTRDPLATMQDNANIARFQQTLGSVKGVRMKMELFRLPYLNCSCSIPASRPVEKSGWKNCISTASNATAAKIKSKLTAGTR